MYVCLFFDGSLNGEPFAKWYFPGKVEIATIVNEVDGHVRCVVIGEPLPGEKVVPITDAKK